MQIYFFVYVVQKHSPKNTRTNKKKTYKHAETGCSGDRDVL